MSLALLPIVGAGATPMYPGMFAAPTIHTPAMGFDLPSFSYIKDVPFTSGGLGIPTDVPKLGIPFPMNHEEAWATISRNIIDTVNDRIPAVQEAATLVYDVTRSASAPLGDAAYTGFKYGAGLAGEASDEGIRMAGRGIRTVIGESSQMGWDAVQMMARTSASSAWHGILGAGEVLGQFLKSVALYAGSIIAVPVGVVTGLLASGKLAFMALGRFFMKVGTYLTRPGTTSRAVIMGAKAGAEAIWEGAGVGAAMARAGTAFAYEKGGRAVRGAIRGGRAGAAMLGRAAAKVGEMSGRAGAALSRGAVAAKESAKKGIELAGRGAAAVARGSKAALEFGEKVVTSTAFKVASGVFQIGMEALNLYMIYNQANDLQFEMKDLDHIKQIVNEGVDPSQKFQVDEYIRQREAAVAQHKLNLGINSTLAVASGVVTLSAIAAGAAMLGPLGWLGLAIGAIACGAMYLEQREEEARIANDKNDWLVKWYGSSTQPSLETYLLKRDPTGETGAWMKSVMSMREESDGKGWTKFGIYLWMLQKKIKEITLAAEAGLFDNRFEELRQLKALNNPSGMSILQKRWEGIRMERGTKIQSVYEEGELMSVAIGQDIKEGRVPEVYEPVTQQDLDYFFRGGPKPGTESVADDAAKDLEAAGTRDEDGNFIPQATDPYPNPHYIPEYYKEEAGTRPTGGQAIRGSWEQIAIDEDKQQAEEEARAAAEGSGGKTIDDLPDPDTANSQSMEQPSAPTQQSGPPPTPQDSSQQPTADIWRYPQDAKRAFSQQGLLYDESLRNKRPRL
jgi:hypothetical protein